MKQLLYSLMIVGMTVSAKAQDQGSVQKAIEALIKSAATATIQNPDLVEHAELPVFKSLAMALTDGDGVTVSGNCEPTVSNATTALEQCTLGITSFVGKYGKSAFVYTFILRNGEVTGPVKLQIGL